MENNKKFSLTAAQLKWLAIILMFLNHFCYALYLYKIDNNYFLSDANWYLTRIAFVIFAYQIAEGMHYTRDRKKYIITLFLFALVSEIPNNLLFYNSFFEFSDQNVLFDLAISALAIAVIDKFDKKPIFTLLITLIAMATASLINADYAMLAEALIISFYYFRDDKNKQLIISAIVFTIFSFVLYIRVGILADSMTIAQILSYDGYLRLIFVELHGLLAWPLLRLYHGEKGKRINKYFFYIFYPGHLLLIKLIVMLLKA